MNISSAERYERTQEIISFAQSSLSQIDTSLLGRDVPYAAMLENAEILDVSPSGALSSAQTDNIAIVGMRSKINETIRIGLSYAKTSQNQRNIILDTISKWGPTSQTAESILNETYDSGVTGEPVPFRILPTMGAAVISLSRLLSIKKQDYIKPPNGQVAQLHFRPIIAIAIDDDPSHDAEMIAHELTHIDQRLTRPLRVHDNQTQTNRDILRNELEAYHVGALVLLHQAGIQSISDITPEMSKASQAMIDSIRHKLNRHVKDPFLVTPDLERELNKRLSKIGYGISSLIHGPVNVEEAIQVANTLDIR